MNRTKRFYISGPITGHDPGMVQMDFENAENRLHREGIESVINPFNSIGRMGRVVEKSLTRHTERDTLTHDEFMQVCLTALQLCGAMLLLPGWRSSSGCCIEVGAAVAWGLDLYELSEDGTIQGATL